MIGPLDELEAVPIEEPLERRYAVRETRVRLHQARFRGRVLAAYRDSCAICRLKELRLLDAAHIVGDTMADRRAGRLERPQPLLDPPPAFDQTSSGSRRTTAFTSRGVCWRTRTGRCSIS